MNLHRLVARSKLEEIQTALSDLWESFPDAETITVLEWRKMTQALLKIENELGSVRNNLAKWAKWGAVEFAPKKKLGRPCKVTPATRPV